MKETKIYLLIFALILTIILLVVVQPAEAKPDPELGMLWNVSVKQKQMEQLEDPRVYLYWYGAKQGLALWEIKRFDGIIDCESTWRPWVSNGQYKGLMQIGTWEYKTYGQGDPFNPYDNIRSGIAYYKVTGFHVWECK